MAGADTIFALASGTLPSGVAVIRVSGDGVGRLWPALGVAAPVPRLATLAMLRDGRGERLDQALLLHFPAPASFTGEHVVELHCHGGRATVAAVLRHLAALDGFRQAEAGEFARRAFENGKLDLTALEGLSDLVAAETEAQRRQALQQADGDLRRTAEGWQSRLLRARAMIEASFDFSDEEDVPDDVGTPIWNGLRDLRDEIADAVTQAGRGRIVREGYQVVLAGPPNAGKSSLLNALAQDEVAIVTDVAGTTRDLVHIELDLDGMLVRVTDTAGLRSSEDTVERIGIDRARRAMACADLVLWLRPSDRSPGCDEAVPAGALPIRTKADLHPGTATDGDGPAVSVISGAGLEGLRDLLATRARQAIGGGTALASRRRHGEALDLSLHALEEALRSDDPLEFRADALRRANDALDRLLGRTDVEDLLGVIFAEFCVGK